MIVDLLKFTVQSGQEEAAAVIMKEQAVATRLDEGCGYAHVFQSRENRTELFMLMSWADNDAVEKHLQTEHDLAFRDKMDDKLVCPPEFFELIV